MTSVATDRGSWLSDFDRLDAGEPLHARRREALGHFEARGFPTRRDEDWRYTDLSPLTDHEFARAAGRPEVDERVVADVALARTPCHRLVFVNGRFHAGHSDPGPVPAGVVLGPLAALLARSPGAVERYLATVAPTETEPFAALNTAFLEDGAGLVLPPDTSLERPVHLVFLTVPGAAAPGGPAVASHPRVLVVAGAGSRCTVIETHTGVGRGRYFANACTEIVAADGATVDHYRVQRETSEGVHVSSTWCVQNGPSGLTSSIFTLGGRLVCNDVVSTLDAEGCDATFNGLYLPRGDEHVDNHLRVRHMKPRCRSWEYYKGILDDRARAVFTGRIFVAEDAQKTDAKQTNMNLLLSEQAGVTTKPQLEIFADDVRCTHGATIGQIEESQLFYMQARGIAKETARSLLIYAFANESIAQVRVDELRERLERTLLARLPQGHELGAAS